MASPRLLGIWVFPSCLNFGDVWGLKWYHSFYVICRRTTRIWCWWYDFSHCSFFFPPLYYIIVSTPVLSLPSDLARKITIPELSFFRRWAGYLEVAPYGHSSNMEGFQDLIVRPLSELLWSFCMHFDCFKTHQAVNLDWTLYCQPKAISFIFEC